MTLINPLIDVAWIKEEVSSGSLRATAEVVISRSDATHKPRKVAEFDVNIVREIGGTLGIIQGPTSSRFTILGEEDEFSDNQEIWEQYRDRIKEAVLAAWENRKR